MPIRTGFTTGMPIRSGFDYRNVRWYRTCLNCVFICMGQWHPHWLKIWFSWSLLRDDCHGDVCVLVDVDGREYTQEKTGRTTSPDTSSEPLIFLL